MSFKISIIGPVNIDLIIKGQAPTTIPELNNWVGASKIFFIPAGAAGYISQNLRKLNNEIHLVTCIGDDLLGKMILDSFEKQGINTTYVQIEEGKEGAIAIFILLFGDYKRPLTFKLPTHHGWPQSFDNATKKYLLDADLLHISGFLHFPDLWTDELPNLYKIAKKKGIRTSLDPQFPLTNIEPPWIEFLKPLIREVEILMLDESEAVNITGTNSIKEAAEYFINEGVEIVAIKLGPKGVFIKDKERSLPIPAIEPKTFIDKIGAGDSFDAGFLYGLLKSNNIKSAALTGLFAAAKSIEGIGGTEKFPNKEEIDLKK